MSRVGPIINEFYQLMLKPIVSPGTGIEKIKLSARTVARIVAEGGVAADLQLALELLRTPGKPSNLYQRSKVLTR